MKVGGQLHASAALPLGKELPLPTEQGNGWVPELVATFLRSVSLPPLGFKPLIVKPTT